MVDVARPLAPFLRRPPTPPKERTSKLSEDNGFQNGLIIHHSLDTPDESPSSSAEYFKTTSERARKKVGFSGWTQFHRPPSNTNKSYDSDDLRSLPPSRDCKSSKSILKPSADYAALDGINALLTFDNSNLPAMLRSAIQHLSSDSRSSHLDAYGSLLACLSTYEDVPNAGDLAGGVAEIVGHIRRDVSTRTLGDGSMSIQLATQALKLVTVFLCTPSLAVNIPDDFRSFIVEQSFGCLENENVPKIIVSHYMHLLERQKFGPKIMTAERAKRLLLALDSITIRVKGNRIIGHRLMIYQRLLSQAKSVMAFEVERWIDHLVAGLLSTIKDIRARAIPFGIEAGLQLGAMQIVSKACLDVFNRKSPEGEKVVDRLCSRLTEMMGPKDEAVHVAQIWSVAILFLRSHQEQIERWEHLRAWLIIIQRCFNHGDAQVKFQAYLAWNRFMFAINIGTTTAESVATMLKQPLVTQLERNRNDKFNEKSKLPKQIARSSYCTLLYYALRPSATHAQLDQYWDLYVAGMIPKSFALDKHDINHACDILSALLSNHGQYRIWDQNRANLNGPVKPEELPSLDSKWVRSRVGKIMQVFDKLFSLADWQLDADREAPLILSWRSFMSALGQASSKEIKISTDTADAVAHILNQVKRCSNHSVDQRSSCELPKRIHALIKEAVSKIGNLAFNEKCIVLSNHSCFEAILESPSSRSRNSQGSPNSAAIHLLHLLLLDSQEHHDRSDRTSLTRYYIQIILESTQIRQNRLTTLRNLTRSFFPADSAFSLHPRLVLWQVIAEYTSSALELPRISDSHSSSSQPPGHEYRDAVKVLEVGVQQQSRDNFPVWQRLYNQITDTIDREIGSAGTSIMVTEPLAAAIRRQVENQCDELSIHPAVQILGRVYWPQSRHWLDRAQFQLWGVVQGGQKSTTLDPYDELYTLLDTLLNQTYGAIDTLHAMTQTSVIAAITSVMHSCPPGSKAGLIGNLQRGLAAWIEDPREKMAGAKLDIYPAVKKMWALVATVIESVPESGNDLLSEIGILVTASLRSRHKTILNDAVVMWNRTFGCVEALDYSEDLRRTLMKLKLMTDIDVPGFSEADEQEVGSSPLRFIESPDPIDEVNGAAQSDGQTTPEMRIFRLGTHSTDIATTQRIRQVRASASPLPSGRRSAKTTPKSRLRHDDSQIQFAAIESSPLGRDIIDSQLLTDRQKEIKERQGCEAVMFPEIRTSPTAVTKASISNLPELALKPSQGASAGLNPDDETSPTFPSDTVMNGFLGSSPTPSSGRNRSQDRFSDDDPPSSPPFVSSHFQLRRESPPATEQGARPIIQDIASSKGHNRGPVPLDEQVEVFPATDDLQEIQDGVKQKYLSDTNILSDFDIYVDAPSEPQIHSSSDPVEPHADKEQSPKRNEDIQLGMNGLGATKVPQGIPRPERSPHNSREPEVSKIMNSFQSETSCISIDDEQAAAQLLAEMEGAQSQQSIQSGPGANRAPKSKKRKSPTDNAPRKWAKTSIFSRGIPLEREVPNAGEDIAECVLIHARPTVGNLRAKSPETVIKREHSASPDAPSFISTVDETPMSGRRRPRRRRQLPASPQSSQGLPDMTRSPRHVYSKSVIDDDAYVPHTVPKRKMRKRTRSSNTSSAPMDTSSDPLHAEDSLLQTSMSSSAVSASLLAEGDPANEGPSLVVRQDEAPDQQPNTRPVQRPTPQSILDGFRSMFNNIKEVALRPEEERAMVSILFESVQQVHEAGRRHSSARPLI